jgi:hypothetical protein
VGVRSCVEVIVSGPPSDGVQVPHSWIPLRVGVRTCVTREVSSMVAAAVHDRDCVLVVANVRSRIDPLDLPVRVAEVTI